MARDVRKQAKEGRALLGKNIRYDISAAEIKELIAIAKDNTTFDAVTTAFDFGAAVGARIERNSRKEN